MSSVPAPPRIGRLDLTGLAGPTSFRDVEDYYSRAGVPSSRRWWMIALIVYGYLGGQAVLITALLPATGLDDGVLRATSAGFLAFTSLYGAFLLALIRGNTVRQVRLDRAARANGMVYADRASAAEFAGSAVRGPGHPEVTHLLRAEAGSVGPVGFRAATFQARPGFSARRAGVLQLPLERPTPHLVLENSRSAVLRSTGARVRAGQRLRLEGDFDRTFALHCPSGYERDALYIFTPDLMALLLDVASDCEVELVDGFALLYVGHPWRLWRPRKFAAVHRVAQVLGTKLQRRTAGYRDDRVLLAEQDGYPPVDAGGRRLRSRPTVGSVLSVAVSIAIGAYGVWSLLAR
ncbi:MAG TPA: hypothetical protein VIL55_03335 [Naasia sp.]